MDDTIKKPITLVKEEFSHQLVDLVNSSQLPLFVVEYVLKDLLNEVHIAVTRQLQQDSSQYAAQLKQNNKQEAHQTE